MELRQLRYFERSAELLNFTEAAKSICISQSTLSQQIKQLEEELDVLLFDRVGKKVLLTETGQAFLVFAKQALQQTENGKMVLQDMKSLQTGSLCIGASYSLSILLTQTLIEFSAKYSGIHVELTFATSAELMEKLNKNQLDFILSLESGLGEDAAFEVVSLFESKLRLIVHESHALAQKLLVRFKDYGRYPLVLPSKGFVTRMQMDRIFRERQLEPNINVELNDVSSILKLVATGKWMTILTLESIKDQPGLRAIPIQEIDVATKASLFWTKGIYKKKAALVFAELLQNNTLHLDNNLP